MAVRLIHRSADQRTGGLSGAVIAGFHQAHGTWAVVMDGDLQHPPELVARLVGDRTESRTRPGWRQPQDGGRPGRTDWPMVTVVPRLGFATAAAKMLFPSRLSRLSDPMSGFFAVRLAALDLDRLKPLGFKILLEIAVRQPRLLVAEVPFVFGVRVQGESKASAVEGARFVRHLARLRFDVLKRQIARSSTQSRAVRLRRLIAFGLVGASGMVVNTAALWMFAGHLFNSHYLLAAVLATEVSTTWNFIFTELSRLLRPEARFAAQPRHQVLPDEQRRPVAQTAVARTVGRPARHPPAGRQHHHPRAVVPVPLHHCRRRHLREGRPMRSTSDRCASS